MTVGGHNLARHVVGGADPTRRRLLVCSCGAELADVDATADLFNRWHSHAGTAPVTLWRLRCQRWDMGSHWYGKLASEGHPFPINVEVMYSPTAEERAQYGDDDFEADADEVTTLRFLTRERLVVAAVESFTTLTSDIVGAHVLVDNGSDPGQVLIGPCWLRVRLQPFLDAFERIDSDESVDAWRTELDAAIVEMRAAARPV